jgi:phosphoribosyl-AMP cyclohydrolase
MNVSKIEAIRVDLDDDLYIVIIPSANEDGARDFWLYSKSETKSVFMFALRVDSDEDAVNIAVSNVDSYAGFLTSEE